MKIFKKKKKTNNEDDFVNPEQMQNEDVENQIQPKTGQQDDNF